MLYQVGFSSRDYSVTNKLIQSILEGVLKIVLIMLRENLIVLKLMRIISKASRARNIVRTWNGDSRQQARLKARLTRTPKMQWKVS